MASKRSFSIIYLRKLLSPPPALPVKSDEPCRKDYTLLDNAGNAVRVAMPEETFIDILAITGGNPFASLVIVNGDIWELKSIWYNKEYHTWRDERN